MWRPFSGSGIIPRDHQAVTHLLFPNFPKRGPSTAPHFTQKEMGPLPPSWGAAEPGLEPRKAGPRAVPSASLSPGTRWCGPFGLPSLFYCYKRHPVHVSPSPTRPVSCLQLQERLHGVNSQVWECMRFRFWCHHLLTPRRWHRFALSPLRDERTGSSSSAGCGPERCRDTREGSGPPPGSRQSAGRLGWGGRGPGPGAGVGCHPETRMVEKRHEPA